MVMDSCGTGISLQARANSRNQRVTSFRVGCSSSVETACRFQASLVSVGNLLKAC